ncbi:SDH family Clp fold serine proteinase [Thermoflavimicrobium dichotomicum]|uniref:Serine protease, ClpP class n=1 Tax=Thermoflavimicrobium dichotomicum TaxID=46223 RepID=A0A1I3TAL1_9BACL|nr:ATP-dependent Clp protease proteolytic subunit [Thermoflavimicrobium dichotomicum]SFJ66537.1 serine protease, ClpP class [Thermoflavimicrobium dichotomicum]
MMDILLLLFILYGFLPFLKQWKVNQDRYRTIRSLEQSRGSRVITMIHRQETLSFFGIPFRNFINIEDSEQILRAIRLTPDNMPIDLILHTPGGLVLAAEQIAEALKKHPSKVTVFIPHYAMSGGTMISLAADEIVLDENAVLGPVDPQLGRYPAASILQVLKIKDSEEISDETLILADIAQKAIHQVRAFVKEVLVSKMDEERADQLARILAEGRWTHDYPITGEQLRDFGLPVRFGLPEEVYQLMELYPQSPTRRPTVQYIPMPYRNENHR